MKSPVIRQLLEIQDRDQRFNSLSKSLKEIPLQKKRAEGLLAHELQQVETAQASLREIELKIKALQLDVQTRRNTIAKLKDQQFATRKNEEFQAMGKEIIRYEQDVHDLEDKELEFMEELESRRPSLIEAQEALKKSEERVKEEVQELDERVIAIQARLKELEGEKAALLPAVEPSVLSIYQRLFKSKGDAAVVNTDNGNCGGCHMRLISGTLQKLRESSDALVMCEQCGRILFDG